MGCPRIAGVTCSEELGTMSKNNLRGISLGIRPIPGIHSLSLIISCLFTPEAERFQKASLLKPFSKLPLFPSAFSNSVVLVWTIGKNASKRN